MHPVLNMCQEMAKHCLRSGQAFSISGSSTGGITFSTPGFNSFPRSSRIWHSPSFNKKTNHKTPSQRRRDQRRWIDHQKKISPSEELNPAGGSNSGTGPQHPVTKPPAGLQSANGSQPPVTGSQSTPTVTVSQVTGSQPPSTGLQPPTPGTLSPSTGSQPPENGTQPPENGTQPPANGTPPPANGTPPSQTLMEVDPLLPPPLISPLASPSKGLNPPTNKINPSQQTIFELPEDLDVEAPLIIIVNSETSKNETSKAASAIASLRRSLKKCNLKSLNPENVISQNNSFGYKLNVPSSRFKHVIRGLHKNWISIDQAFINGFLLTRHGGTYLSLPQSQTILF